MALPVPRRRFLASLGALVLAACAPDARHAALPRGARVIALGDSLTYGTGASPAESWPALLAQRSGWQVENAGVPGETAAQACERLPDLLAANRPALVLVLVGGNDFLRRTPDAGVRDALAACVAEARAAAVPIVLLPVPRLGVGGLANAPLYAEAAKSLGTPLVDAGLADALAKPALRADAVHPNAAGYRAVAERIGAGLAKLGFLR
ncbi:MAG: GDSL-type esterase/lipase family protein [Betaproteobacteria bacterium]|nr:GDSL-type esterase/lipase family protein [Betaproteobacteria bacterium]